MNPIEALSSFPTTPIRAAFFDIDGALLGSSHELTHGVVAEISRIKRSGIKVGLASGRAYFAAKTIAKSLGLTDPCVVFAGAAIMDPISERPLVSHLISPNTIIAVLEALSNLPVLLELYTTTEYFAYRPHELIDIHMVYLKQAPVFADLVKVATSSPIIKIEVVLERETSEGDVRSVLANFPDLSLGFGTVSAHPHLYFANITSGAASRENAFNFLCNHLALAPSEIATFGDAEADMPFLKLAGHGVAMGNAPENVKKSAKHVTRHVDEDGVAFALKKLVP